MTKDLTMGSPVRLILGFAVPLLAGMLFQQLYNFVDTMIVGRFLGVTALAGVGATGSINFLVLGFCMGVCSGFAIPVAQRFGAKEESRMREFVANGVWVAAIFATVITALTVANCRDILAAMHTPEDCFEEAYRYIVVIFAGIPFTILYNLLSGYLRSLGDSKTPLFFLVLSSVLNVGLDLLLILVFRLGVLGASLATVISQAISGLLCLAWIGLKFPILHITREEWRLRSRRVKELCAYGVPMGLQYSITAIGSVILQVAVNSLGSLAVAAATAGGKVLGFLACPFDALGSTMATYGAQNVGASRYDRLNRGLLASSAMGFVYSVAAVLIVWGFGPSLTRLFVTGEGSAELIGLAQQYMMITVFFYPLLTLVNVVRFMIQGMGFSAFAILAGVMEMFARSAAGLLLVPVLGFPGAALGGPLAWVFADAFLVPAYFKCRRTLMSRAHHVNIAKKGA
ncbi:MAG: MATE family efflux transporter [Clostridiales bacterium]|nr:MATE family efflux transporter [Clostridiales bacterium]MDY5513346.1 MATE family efflux transporter [Candidatus Ventricola sp.]